MYLPVGVHACCRFDDPRQRAQVVAEFVSAGLARGERVAVFSRQGAPAWHPAGAAFRSAQDSGQVLSLVAEDAYFQDGRFDGARRVKEFAALARETVAAGYPALRVYADNGAMPAALSNPDLWLEYEMRVVVTTPVLPLIGLCGFSVDDPPGLPMDLLDAVHEHNLTMAPRPSGFHVRGRHDGSFELAGRLEQSDLPRFRRVLDAGRPVLRGNVLSLRGLDFVDRAGARELFQLTRSSTVSVWAVPPVVRSMWLDMGLQSETPAAPRVSRYRPRFRPKLEEE